MNILFVCTGNICRSPSAEALLREKLSLHNQTTHHIDSVGVAGYHIGDAPDPRALISAQRYGVDMAALRARKICAADFVAFDIILAMDRGHLSTLLDICPAAHRHKVRLFNEEIYQRRTDVEDPYYGGQHDFDMMFEKLDAALDIFVMNHT